MSKIYGIICDRDYSHVLVGLGGTSGYPPVVRRGWHLPGGTIDHTGRTEAVILARRVAALRREIDEEFGRFRGWRLERLMLDPDRLTHHGNYLNGHSVYFNIYNLDVSGSGLRAYEGPVPDGKIDVNDSSFSRVNAVGLEDAMDEFKSDPGNTGWFAYGCKYTLSLRGL